MYPFLVDIAIHEIRNLANTGNKYYYHCFY